MLELLLENDLLSAIIAFALVLIPAIIIHELGHFIAAKMAGISVLEFGIGFPPRMIRLFMWGETEFTLNWIPLGGFVRPLGEDLMGPMETDYEPDEDDEYDEKRKNQTDQYLSERDELRRRGVPDEAMKSVSDAKPLARIWFMAAGALANFATAILLFILIALIGLPVTVGARVQIAHIPSDSMFAGTPVRESDAVELINGEYFASMQDYLNQITAANGSSLTLTMRDVEANDRYDVIVTPRVSDKNGYIFLAGIAENSPAEEAGLQAGDLITAIEGEPLPGDSNPIPVIQNLVQTHAGQPVELTILRDNTQRFDVMLTPRVDPPPGEGALGVIIREQYGTGDGVRYIVTLDQEELIPQPPVESIKYGFQHTFDIVKLIVSLPAQLIEGAISPEEARPVSIVGISQVGGQILQRSITDGTPIPILNFIALVSIFLGFTNLLPIPALDGGRILFVLIEVVRGKPVSPRVEGIIHYVGFMLLMALGVVIILYDIFNPFTLPQ